MFENAKDFCLNFPKLARKVVCDFCLQSFSHKDHEDVTSTKGLYLFYKLWAPFLEVKQRWAPFLSRFSAIFAQFSVICPDFRQIKSFGGELTPLPHTLLL